MSEGRICVKVRLILLLESAGFQNLLRSMRADPARPEVLWTMLAAEKSPLQAARDLDRIQHMLIWLRLVGRRTPSQGITD